MKIFDLLLNTKKFLMLPFTNYIRFIMKIKYFLFLISIVFYGCSNQKISEKNSYRIDKNNIYTQVDFKTNNKDLSELLQYEDRFNSKVESFDLLPLINSWENYAELNLLREKQEFLAWLKITGFLLELTGEERYASELEQIIEKTNTLGFDVKNQISPFIITQNVDDLYINLFHNYELIYQHSLGGDVKIRIETKDPKAGLVSLHFEMTERRYIELYVRIPKWAEGASVEVKNVKYIAQPGTYSKIAKKWKDGDVVEIVLSKENRSS